MMVAYGHVVLRTYLGRGSLEVTSMGRGMQSIMMSEEMLKTALVMR